MDQLLKKRPTHSTARNTSGPINGQTSTTSGQTLNTSEQTNEKTIIMNGQMSTASG